MLSEPKFLLITKKAEPLRLRRLSHVVNKIFKFCLPIRIGGFDHIKSKVTSSGTSSGLQNYSASFLNIPFGKVNCSVIYVYSPHFPIRESMF